MSFCLTGAFGYFEVTHDITKYTKAKLFNQIGKRTPLGVRFSTVGMCCQAWWGFWLLNNIFAPALHVRT